MWHAKAEQRSRRTLREFESSPCYVRPTRSTSHNQRTAATPVRQKANSVLDARNPTQVPKTIGDLRLIDHLLVEIQTEIFAVVASLLARHYCCCLYRRNAVSAILWTSPSGSFRPSTSRSGAGLTFARQPVYTRMGLVIKRLPFRGVWAARGHSLAGQWVLLVSFATVEPDKLSEPV